MTVTRLMGALITGIVIATSSGTVVSHAAVAPQSPFKPPSNLRVLSKDTTLATIVPMMKTFTSSLGVRCEFCHSYTGADPSALETFDFASDAVPTKLTTRKMMGVVQSLNGDLLRDIGMPRLPDQPKVSCFTCHRGERKPSVAPGPPR